MSRSSQEIRQEMREMEQAHGENVTSLSQYWQLRNELDAAEGSEIDEMDRMDAQIDALRRESNLLSRHKTYNSSEYDAERDAVVTAEMERLEAVQKAYYRAKRIGRLMADGWDTETTRARRAEWNALVASGQAQKWGLAYTQERLGWRLDDLQAAVEIHEL